MGEAGGGECGSKSMSFRRKLRKEIVFFLGLPQTLTNSAAMFTKD